MACEQFWWTMQKNDRAIYLSSLDYTLRFQFGEITYTILGIVPKRPNWGHFQVDTWQDSTRNPLMFEGVNV